MEVQRAKGPNPAENRDPIFERGSTTTYSSFRKLNHAKRWTSEGETATILKEPYAKQHWPCRAKARDIGNKSVGCVMGLVSPSHGYFIRLGSEEFLGWINSLCSFFIFLESCLSSFCCVAGSIVLLRRLLLSGTVAT